MDSSCTPGYVVWGPTIYLDRKGAGNYCSPKQLRSNHWVLLQNCKSGSKKDVDKEIQCLPWSPYLTFLKVRLSSGSADWSLIWNAWDRRDLGKDYSSSKTHSSSLTCLVNSLTAFTCLPWKFVRIWPVCTSTNKHLPANSVHQDRKKSYTRYRGSRKALLGRSNRNLDEQMYSFPRWMLGNVKSRGKDYWRAKILQCTSLP